MNWRFTIINRDNISFVIDEPVGWDSNVVEVKRDAEWHGVFFTNQGDSYIFYGKAMQLLKQEYDTYGLGGKMKLLVEEDCGKGFELFSSGSFMFKDYEYVCGSECYVKVPLEGESELKEIRNRLNQKVNLDSLVAFDGVTPLSHYNNLSFDMSLPSKGIYLKDYSIADNDISEDFGGCLRSPALPFHTRNKGCDQLTFALDEKSAEIGGYMFNAVGQQGTKYNGHLLDITLQGNGINDIGTAFEDTSSGSLSSYIYPLNLSPVVNYYNGSINYGQISNPVALSYLFKGQLKVGKCFLHNVVFYFLRLPDRPDNPNNGEALADYDVLKRKIILGDSELYENDTVAINETLVDNSFVLNKGDRLYIFLAIIESKDNSQIDAVVNYNGKALYFTLYSESFFKIENISYTDNSLAKTFAVNETLSRVVESITNDKLRVYSDFFGRVDSQPYNHSVDGCGSLSVITNGLRLRRQENRLGDSSILAISLQDLFNGLNPIYNIGVGIEKDNNREGNNCVRVEPFEYFYKNEIIHHCESVEEVSLKFYDKEVYSTFNIGYEKWESEQYNGLDEFLTKRSYRTDISETKNELSRLSKFIASGYSLEITRRKSEDKDTKDWRYDKDVFIICTSRKQLFAAIFTKNNDGLDTIKIFTTQFNQAFFIGLTTIKIEGTVNNDLTYSIHTTTSGDGWVLYEIVENILFNENCSTTSFPDISFPLGQYVELGNIENAKNIIDPKTIYNFRISPIRNALRWCKTLFKTYKDLSNAKLLFTDGDANYLAEGKYTGNSCEYFNGVIAENATIDLNLFNDQDDATPINTAERISFKYPLSSKDFNNIQTNPYGLISYKSECCNDLSFGWIDTIQYKPEEGIATFTLIPKKK